MEKLSTSCASTIPLHLHDTCSKRTRLLHGLREWLIAAGALEACHVQSMVCVAGRAQGSCGGHGAQMHAGREVVLFLDNHWQSCAWIRSDVLYFNNQNYL
eukprot:364356-Chlamydomonas_euryale.AAC.9